jgi:hypothetical protein
MFTGDRQHDCAEAGRLYRWEASRARARRRAGRHALAADARTAAARYWCMAWNLAQ